MIFKMTQFDEHSHNKIKIPKLGWVRMTETLRFKGQSSREPLYRDSLSHHRTSDVAYGGFAVMFTKS